MTPFSYSNQQHAENCDCSVCWSKAEMAKPDPCPSTPCDQCRPAFAQPVRTLKMRLVAGAWMPLLSQWQITPAFTCAKHMPSDQPPKYWSVVENIGKPVPYVPLHEPFQLVG
jgi:hypothetical protein